MYIGLIQLVVILFIAAFVPTSGLAQVPPSVVVVKTNQICLEEALWLDPVGDLRNPEAKSYRVSSSAPSVASAKFYAPRKNDLVPQLVITGRVPGDVVVTVSVLPPAEPKSGQKVFNKAVYLIQVTPCNFPKSAIQGAENYVEVPGDTLQITVAPEALTEESESVSRQFRAMLKKTIAVARFEDNSPSSGLIGSGMADQLADALVQSRKFVVIERQLLQDILTEQDFATGGRAAASSTAQKGRLLPAQILIKGAVTEFEAERQKGNTGITISGISLGSNKVMAHVALILRLIDTTSGQVLDSVRMRAEVQDKGSKINVNVGPVQLGKEDFKKTPLGKAAQFAIDWAVSEIILRLEKVPFEGRIIKVEGDTIYTNIGTRNGINEAMLFDVFEPGEELVDPVTGESLGSEKSKIGTLKIMTVQEKFSKASPKSGGPFKVGMILTE
ncbi:CsgG/HfaB family protein [bacterium]|nr:CsgG/HfaB family protein [bacterium]